MDMPHSGDEAAIRGLVAEWSNALEARDADALVARHAADAVIHDGVALAPGRKHVSIPFDPLTGRAVMIAGPDAPLPAMGCAPQEETP